ncbi:hypothetical protein HJG60_010215 [Phyllostomus discolor]|uniref:Uncharacterized protein n=1 Tax=Phyllostomus discolor TaxID=89673 RepID=A0A834AWB0_9CHIR|nr:hypothetical protein HJG60_010215 [Phyllostomus discolor]
MVQALVRCGQQCRSPWGLEVVERSLWWGHPGLRQQWLEEETPKSVVAPGFWGQICPGAGVWGATPGGLWAVLEGEPGSGAALLPQRPPQCPEAQAASGCFGQSWNRFFKDLAWSSRMDPSPGQQREWGCLLCPYPALLLQLLMLNLLVVDEGLLETSKEAFLVVGNEVHEDCLQQSTATLSATS